MPELTAVTITHVSFLQLLQKGYLGQSSTFPHEVTWPIATLWSTRPFLNDAEALAGFREDCKGTGVHTIIAWTDERGPLERAFKWEELQ